MKMLVVDEILKATEDTADLLAGAGFEVSKAHVHDGPTRFAAEVLVGQLEPGDVLVIEPFMEYKAALHSMVACAQARGAVVVLYGSEVHRYGNPQVFRRLYGTGSVLVSNSCDLLRWATRLLEEANTREAVA